MLDNMQARVAVLTHLRSLVLGLVRLCWRAAATLARLCVLRVHARRRCFFGGSAVNGLVEVVAVRLSTAHGHT